MAPKKDKFVRVRQIIPEISVDLKYAGEGNFTGKKIYSFNEAYLRRGTAKKLLAAQKFLKKRGFCLKIWDAFRPVEAQFRLWEAMPDPMFVADPTKCFSNHSRGNTVDVTLIRIDGTEVKMPTDFDDFSARASRDYAQLPLHVRAHALLLEEAMEAGGFSKEYWPEWWHYTDKEDYPVEKEFVPQV